jgi:hypothetical protein
VSVPRHTRLVKVHAAGKQPVDKTPGCSTSPDHGVPVLERAAARAVAEATA